MFYLGIALAVVILLLAFLGTVAAYLGYCAKHPSRKLRTEVVLIAAVLLASLAIRMAIGFNSLPDKSFSDGFTSFFHGLFSAAAGLAFNSLLELNEITGGVLCSLYYGIIVYASLVFLAVVTVGLSYEFYSLVQSIGLRRRFDYFFIFTSITPDSLILAKDIKENFKNKRDKNGKKVRAVIIFFESGEESFSRKNQLHRKIMEEGFLYYSDFRRTDKGNTISLLQKFKFKGRHFKSEGEGYGKLFNVLAMGDCGGFEGENGSVVFNDLESVLSHYLTEKRGKVKGIPTTVNYYLLTGGEINYESYERRLDDLLSKYCSGKNVNMAEVKSMIQVNVFNEATLSSQDLTEKRKAHLNKLGCGAFGMDSQPDENGAYRIAVLGFGKTGQYAMEELYTQTAHLTAEGEGNARTYRPNRFIADIYDVSSDEKSGLFAYNHPLFRCIYGNDSTLMPTAQVIERADKVGGQSFNALYAAYARRSGSDEKTARRAVDNVMQFPVAVYHKQSCFAFPLMDCDRTDAVVKAAKENGLRAIVVALGDDERNIAMANVIIDSFKRAYFTGDWADRHIKIYVNLIERESVKRLDWQSDDEANFTCAASVAGKPVQPCLSVIAFGCRHDMFSYSTIIDDYVARLYNYGYNKIDEGEEAAQEFIETVGRDYDACRTVKKLTESWLKLGQFKRKSNRSAQNFAVNYFEYCAMHGGKVDGDGLAFLGRLEHERWNRFNISHGWIYGDYDPNDKEVYDMRRNMRHHDCLCPYEMLTADVKRYDIINVKLGFIKEIVFGGKVKENNTKENKTKKKKVRGGKNKSGKDGAKTADKK